LQPVGGVEQNRFGFVFYGGTKKHGPLEITPRGPVLKATRTVALSPEIKEGLNHCHPTTQDLAFFLLGFLLGLFLSCHKHLLIGSHGRAFHWRAENQNSGGENFRPKTLPYFVAGRIIITQQIVCQEKNNILEFFCEDF
jgi:hypothetical protein